MRYNPNFKLENFCNNDASRTATIDKLYPSGYFEVTMQCDEVDYLVTERYDDLEWARSVAQDFVDGVPCE